MTTERTEPVSDVAVDRRMQGDRRAGKARAHFPERRTGFDRRADPSIGRRRAAYRRWIRGISESPARSAVLMASIVVLNVADMAFTFAALDRGLEELNPVVAALLDTGHGLAAFVKIGVAVVLAAAGWWFRRFRRVIEAALLVNAIMAGVVFYHLLGLFAV
jgi:hypothetical protein